METNELAHIVAVGVWSGRGDHHIAATVPGSCHGNGLTAIRLRDCESSVQSPVRVQANQLRRAAPGYEPYIDVPAAVDRRHHLEHIACLQRPSKSTVKRSVCMDTHRSRDRASLIQIQPAS